MIRVKNKLQISNKVLYIVSIDLYRYPATVHPHKLLIFDVIDFRFEYIQ